MTKEGSTKIINFMTILDGVPGCGQISHIQWNKDALFLEVFLSSLLLGIDPTN